MYDVYEIDDDSEETKDVKYDYETELSTDYLTAHYRDMGLDDSTIDQLFMDPDQRTWRGCENVDALEHPDYSTQISFGKSENDDYEEVAYGTKDSQRPDEIRFTDQGIDIREVKNWSDADALVRNIRDQAGERYELFGDELNDLTFVVSPKFSLEECDKLEETCRESGADIEFKYH